MAKFTLILDFRGGTYVSQVDARTPTQALSKWATQLDVGEIFGLGERQKERLTALAAEAAPVPLDGLRAVWCVAFSLPSGTALVNVVKTF